jgi:purine-cytosine permease-like protein
MGLAATAVVAGGPRLVGLADRAAVPLMAAIGVVVTVAAVRSAPAVAAAAAAPPAASSWLRGLDIVVGYQVSWILMFADYSRYTRSAPRGAAAVFAGLAIPSLWLMPVGALAASAAASADPGTMLRAIGLGGPGAVLLALATVTTNFVNIYLSSLAWKSLVPATGARTAVWGIGLVGIGVGLLSSGWLDRYAAFMLLLGSLLVPVGGVLLARFFLVRRPVTAGELYDPGGPVGSIDASFAGLAAWAAGAAAYRLAAPIGSTLPALVTAALAFVVFDRRAARAGRPRSTRTRTTRPPSPGEHG